MNALGRALLVVALLAVVGVGIWLVASLRTPAQTPDVDEGGLLEQLVPQPTPTIYPSSSTVIRSIQRLARSGDRLLSRGEGYHCRDRSGAPGVPFWRSVLLLPSARSLRGSISGS